MALLGLLADRPVLRSRYPAGPGRRPRTRATADATAAPRLVGRASRRLMERQSKHHRQELKASSDSGHRGNLALVDQ